MVFKMATIDLTRDIYEDFHQVPLPTSPPSSSATLCCTFTLDLAASITIELACRRKPRVPASAITQDREEDIQVQQGLGRLSEFTLKELKVATSNFRSENILGRGGFGRVYRAQLANGHAAAIKRCREGHSDVAVAQFQVEVKAGNKPNHQNVLPLLGFCTASKRKEYLLVYPLMVNGSVAPCLRERMGSQPPLSWSMRMNIALGVARGLRHLHSLNIIHRDIKAANILLDDKFEPLIGDFGIAIFAGERNRLVQTDHERAAESERGAADLAMASRNSRTKAESELGDLTGVTTAVRGTIGCIAPEYLSTGHCSRKNDIFAFGVMLLELLTGQRPFDLARLANDDDVMLLDWVKGLLKENRLDRIMDQDMHGQYDEGQAKQLIKIALMCMLFYAEERPNAEELVQFVKGNGWHERWENQKDYFMLSQEQYRRLTLTTCGLMVSDSVSHLQPEELSGPR